MQSYPIVYRHMCLSPLGICLAVDWTMKDLCVFLKSPSLILLEQFWLIE